MENINPQTKRFNNNTTQQNNMFQQPQSFSMMGKKNNTIMMNNQNITPQPQQQLPSQQQQQLVNNYMQQFPSQQQQQQYMMMMDPNNVMNQSSAPNLLLQQQQQYMNMIAATMMNQPSQPNLRPNTTNSNTNQTFQQQQQQQGTNFSISNLPTRSVSFNPSNVPSNVPSNMPNMNQTNQSNVNVPSVGSSSNLTKSHSTSELALSTLQQPQEQLTVNASKSKNMSSNTTRVKVVVRVRPQVAEDVANSQIFGEYPPCVANVKNTVILKRECYDDREFSFDRVLESNTSQDEMYKEVGKNIVDDVMKGYNGTVLAYGQTGSGKTFTIFGSSTDPKKVIRPSESIIDKYSGVIPRCIHQIFQHIQQNSNSTEFRVFVSFMQIYMENIMDLLDSSKTNLPIREDPKNGVFVEQLTQVQVNEPYEVMQLIKEGSKNREVNSTNMNKTSSRSHVILMLTVEQKSFTNNGTTSTSTTGISTTSTLGNILPPDKDSKGSVKRGVLHIVDLAGSERVFKSGSEGQRLEEAKKINKSLSALGNCVAALTEENVSHVPFRDSKLTRLLTDSLGGNAKTCLVATVGPSMWNYDESYSTLHFASRAMNVKNHAVINEVVDFKILSGNLQKKITVIENEKVKLMERNVDLEREVSLLRNEMASLSKSGRMVERGSNSWEARERELTDKFGNVIRHLQMEIAKQNIMFNKARRLQAKQNAMTSQSGDALESVIDGFLAVPSVKQRIIAKLVEQGEVKEISPWAEEKSPQRADDIVNSILQENSSSSHNSYQEEDGEEYWNEGSSGSVSGGSSSSFDNSRNTSPRSEQEENRISNYNEQ